jgi:tetratricopeptide (TPR) repeat protein
LIIAQGEATEEANRQATCLGLPLVVLVQDPAEYERYHPQCDLVLFTSEAHRARAKPALGRTPSGLLPPPHLGSEIDALLDEVAALAARGRRPATLTLCMTVRNEAPSLPAAISSVRSIVDDMVIGVDERSEDDTLEIAERSGARVFRFCEPSPADFPRMRNRALDLVETDWAIVLDGHEWLENPESIRAALETTAWSIETQLLFEPNENGIPLVSYLFPKIHRRHVRFVGPSIHEEVSTPLDRRVTRRDIKIWHERPPGRASEARARERVGGELEALRAAWQQEGNRRALFYLANGLRDAGRYDEAITAYGEYLRAPAWEEEGWHAQLSLARCYASLSRWDEARDAFERAVLAWPERAEPIVGLGYVLLEMNEARAAAAWFRMATSLPEPQHARLFVEVPAYRWVPWHGLALTLARLGDLPGAIDAEREALERGAGDWAHQNIDAWLAAESPDPWQPLFDATIHSYYAGDLPAGREAAERLLARDDLPEHVRLQARRNQTFYAPPLGEIIPDVHARALVFPTPLGWSRFNPTIAPHEDGFVALVRSSNYVVDDGMRYTIHGGDEVIRTAYYRLEISPDLAIRSVERISDDTGPEGLSAFPVAGYEDCRLFRYRDVWYASATARDRNPEGICQMALVTLEGASFRDLTLLTDSTSGRHEKNWMPLVVGDQLLFITSCSPTVVMRYDPRVRAVDEISRQEGPGIAREFRGGSQGVQLDDGYLFIVHESVPLEDGGRVCPHRFVLMDRDLAITHVSDQFFFLQRQLEFCAGLARHDDMLVAAFGVRDADAFLMPMALHDVMTTLRPV